jgi:peptide/nickel transport system ATP-binding protein
VREAHKRVDPQLEPVPDDAGHSVACLLAADVRRDLWAKLRAGAEPEEARAEVPLRDEDGLERRDADRLSQDAGLDAPRR